MYALFLTGTLFQGISLTKYKIICTLWISSGTKAYFCSMTIKLSKCFVFYLTVLALYYFYYEIELKHFARGKIAGEIEDL